jgi:hypothetical protein
VTAAATADELVELIISELKPFREQWHGAVPSIEEVRAAVWGEIHSLRKMGLYDRDAIVKTRKDARNIIRAADNLQNALITAGRELQLRLKLDFDRPEIFDELNAIRKECGSAINQGLTSGRKDQVKRRCAQRASILILKLSKHELTYADDSIFPRVTAFIYEIVSPGSDDFDEDGPKSSFRRLCKELMNDLAQLHILSH